MRTIVALNLLAAHTTASRSRTFNISSSNIELHTSAVALASTSTTLRKYGDPACPCIGIDNVQGETVVITKKGKDDIVEAKYPADLGARCHAWDDGVYPQNCVSEDQDPGKGKGWCKERWCYVDPCHCDLPTSPKLAIYVPFAESNARPVYYSYATCGGSDERTAMLNPGACMNNVEPVTCNLNEKCKWHKDKGACVGKEIVGLCKDPDFFPAEKKWGKETCRCIGLNNVVGNNNVKVGEKIVKYPGDTGSICKAWDDTDKHPECGGSAPPSYCKQEWCYVDPCDCDLEVPPKQSYYLPESTFRGRPIHYSYATCGSVDEYATAHKDEIKAAKKDLKAICSGVVQTRAFVGFTGIVTCFSLMGSWLM